MGQGGSDGPASTRPQASRSDADTTTAKTKIYTVDGERPSRPHGVGESLDDHQKLHEALATDPAWRCDGHMMRVALRGGRDAFVLWHLTHCPANDPEWLTMEAVKCGRVAVVEYLVSRGTGFVSGGVQGVIKEAMVQGAMDIIHWLHETVDGEWTTMAMDTAAEHGQLSVVQWLHTHRTEGCSTDALDHTARNGHQDVVEWLHVHRNEGGTVLAMDGAAQNGHLSVVQWLHANRSEGCSTEAMDGAAKNGHLDGVQWLHQNRVEGCTTRAMDGAASNGHLRVLQWLHATRTDGCTTEAMDQAARNGHLEVVQWLHEHQSE